MNHYPLADLKKRQEIRKRGFASSVPIIGPLIVLLRTRWNGIAPQHVGMYSHLCSNRTSSTDSLWLRQKASKGSSAQCKRIQPTSTARLYSVELWSDRTAPTLRPGVPAASHGSVAVGGVTPTQNEKDTDELTLTCVLHKAARLLMHPLINDHRIVHAEPETHSELRPDPRETTARSSGQRPGGFPRQPEDSPQHPIPSQDSHQQCRGTG